VSAAAPPASGAPGRFAELSGALLLGGASSRMGRDKAGLQVGAEASAVRLAHLLEGLCAEVLLVGGAPPAGAPGRRVPDPPGPRCALRGLVAALEAARTERLLVLATDLLGVTPDLLLALLAWPEAAAVVPRDPEGSQPLCALYRPDRVRDEARRRLEAGELSLRGLLEALDARFLEGPDLEAVDPAGTALLDVNTPGELREALARLQARSGEDS